MSLVRLLGPVILGGAVFLGGCSSVEESSSRDLSQEAPVEVFSIDDILRAYSEKIVPIYAYNDSRIQQHRFEFFHDDILGLLQKYLAGIDEDAINAISQSQRPMLAVVYADLGRAYLFDEKPREAVAAYELALKLDGYRSARIFFDYARALSAADRQIEALYFFEKAYYFDRTLTDAKRFARRIERELHLPRLRT